MIRVFGGVRLGPKWQINSLSRRHRRIPEGQLSPCFLPRGPWAIWESFSEMSIF